MMAVCANIPILLFFIFYFLRKESSGIACETGKCETRSDSSYR